MAITVPILFEAWLSSCRLSSVLGPTGSLWLLVALSLKMALVLGCAETACQGPRLWSACLVWLRVPQKEFPLQELVLDTVSSLHWGL